MTLEGPSVCLRPHFHRHPAFPRVRMAPDRRDPHLPSGPPGGSLSAASHVGQLESQQLTTGLPWRHSSTGRVWLLGTSMPDRKRWRSGSVGLLRVFGCNGTLSPARSIRGSCDKQKAKVPTHSDPGVGGAPLKVLSFGISARYPGLCSALAREAGTLGTLWVISCLLWVGSQGG